MEAVNNLCPKNSNLFASISLSASSVVRRTEELGENIVAQIQQKAENCLWYSLAMDESTDLTSTSQLLISIGGVNLDFEITEQLASVCSMYETTTGEDLFLELEKTLQCYSLRWIMSKLEDLHLGKALFFTVLYISKHAVRNTCIFLA